MALEFNPEEGKTTYEILEYPIIGSSSAALYDSDGIEFSYGYAERKSHDIIYGSPYPDGHYETYKNYNYGGLESSSADSLFDFGGIEYSPGLHGITLSRSLEPGEKITIKWKNGYELVLYGELINWNAENVPYTRVKIISGGSYQETGKWVDESGNSEHVCPKFNDDVYTKRFDYIETKNFKELE